LRAPRSLAEKAVLSLLLRRLLRRLQQLRRLLRLLRLLLRLLRLLLPSARSRPPSSKTRQLAIILRSEVGRGRLSVAQSVTRV